MKCLYRGYIYEAVGLSEMAFASSDRLGKGENPVQFSSLVDNKSRFELDASDMTLDFTKFNKLSNTSSISRYIGKLGDVLKYDDLYKYYPNASNINVELILDTEDDIKGKDKLNGITSDGSKIIVTMLTKEGILDTLEHEIQHYIQKADSRYSGGRPSLMTDSDIDDVESEFYSLLKQRNSIIKRIRKVFSELAEEAIPNVYRNSFKFKENKDSEGKGIGSGVIVAINKSTSPELRSEVGKIFKEFLLDEPSLPGLREEFMSISEKLTKYTKDHNIKSTDKQVNPYYRLAGESEARVAMSRRKLNAVERETTPFDITDGYPLDRIIKR